MKNILLRGYYGYNNFGDDALLSTMLNKVFNDRSKYKVTVLSNNKGI